MSCSLPPGCLGCPASHWLGRGGKGPLASLQSHPVGPTLQAALVLSPFNPMAECTDPCLGLPGASLSQAPVFPATSEGGGEVAAWLRGAGRIWDKGPGARSFPGRHRGAWSPGRSWLGQGKGRGADTASGCLGYTGWTSWGSPLCRSRAPCHPPSLRAWHLPFPRRGPEDCVAEPCPSSRSPTSCPSPIP